MNRNKWIVFLIVGSVFILFNLVFVLNDWSMVDDWQVYQFEEEGVLTIFRIMAVDRLFPVYRLFYWGLGRLFGSNLLGFYVFQNSLLLISLIILYKFAYSFTKSRKISFLVPLVFLNTTSFGENYCRLGTPQPLLLPFLVLIMVISYNFIFKEEKKVYLVLTGLLFFLSFLTNESAAFILPSFVAFFLLLCILKERSLSKKVLYVLCSLVVGFAVRMVLFFLLGGRYFTGKGYGNSIFGIEALFASLLRFPFRCPLIVFLILSCICLYIIDKRCKKLSRNDELQIIYITMLALFPLSLLMFWQSGPRAYLLLPFIPPILIVFAKLFTHIKGLKRNVILTILCFLMLGGTLLNIRFFTVFFSRNNTYQNMLAYVSDIITKPNQRVLLNLERGGWIETYNATYYYLKNRYDKKVYLGSFVPVQAETIFRYWDKSLAEEGLESFQSEKEDVIQESDIVITFSREAFDLSAYYSGNFELQKEFESLTWLTNLTYIKKGRFFDKEYWSIYMAY